MVAISILLHLLEKVENGSFCFGIQYKRKNKKIIITKSKITVFLIFIIIILSKYNIMTEKITVLPTIFYNT